MICDIEDNPILEKISKLFSQAIEKDYIIKRYGIKKCNAVLDYNILYDILNLYKRSLERDECNICSDDYCCTSQLEERIKTL